MLITHDLGVVAEVAERVMVMYAGRKVEEAPVAQLFRTPAAPLHARPARRGAEARLVAERRRRRRLAEIPGVVPSLKQRIDGCVFAGRCAQATDLCRQAAPALETKAPGHLRRLPLRAEGGAGRMSAPLLEVNDLKKHFRIHARLARHRRGHGLCRRRRVVHASTRARRWRWSASPAAASRRSASCILRLFDITAGQVVLDGQRIDDLSAGALRPLRRAHAGGVPGPVLQPQPAHAGARHPGRADPQFRPGQIRRRARGAGRAR